MPKEKKKLSGKCLGVLAFGWCLNHFTASKLQNQKSATCGLQTTISPTPALLGANAQLSLGDKRIEPSTAPHNDENNDSEPPPRRKVKGVASPPRTQAWRSVISVDPVFLFPVMKCHQPR